ncbi:MAG TPA: hypothetical protein QF901_14150, partial [Gammaproteobacteria bacterium]|nr:hypothetical protein [Gammaproteobacteria bacterium]
GRISRYGVPVPGPIVGASAVICAYVMFPMTVSVMASMMVMMMAVPVMMLSVALPMVASAVGERRIG